MNKLKYFGVITVIVEWLGVLIASRYINGFNFNNAISTLSVAPRPLSLIFSLTITFASISFFLYALSLREYSNRIPVYALIASLAFMIVGWVPLRSNGSISDSIHSICGIIATIGYTLIIWECRKHPKKHISIASVIITSLLLLIMIASILSLYVFHKYVAIVEILIVVSMQYWLIYVTWHSRATKAVANSKKP